jgi:hypothetical protein
VSINTGESIMPNWCNNEVTITHEDPAMLERLEEAWRKGRLFAEVIPEPDYAVTPVALTYPDVSAMFAKTEEERAKIMANEPTIREESWWDWRVQNWGTKWDVGGPNDEGEAYLWGNQQLRICFESAWSPPTGIYEELIEQGYGVTAYYWEPGCAFCGRFTTEAGDETFKDDAPPPDIDAVFCITQFRAEMEADQ